MKNFTWVITQRETTAFVCGQLLTMVLLIVIAGTKVLSDADDPMLRTPNGQLIAYDRIKVVEVFSDEGQHPPRVVLGNSYNQQLTIPFDTLEEAEAYRDKLTERLGANELN